jgi:Prp8 binding protein
MNRTYICHYVRRFDVRAGLDRPDLVLEGHSDTITGLSLHPDQSLLLSNSMDSTLRIFDLRPLPAGSRNKHVLTGVHHGAEKLLLRCAWSSEGDYISAGSADRLVHLWDGASGREVCAWPGHKASVNQVAFHPSQPVLASASSDRSIVLGEFTPP